MNKKRIFILASLTAGLSLQAGVVLSFQQGDLRNITTDTVIDASYTHTGVGIRADQGGSSDNGSRTIIGRENGDALRGLYEFDLSAIPGGVTIDSVSFVLNIKQNGSGGNTDIGVYEYGFDTSESATWNVPGLGDATAGGTIGTLLSSATSPGGAGPADVTFGDTSAFRTAVGSALASDNVVRFLVKQVGVGSEFRRFTSDDDGTIEDRPELLIEYTVPEPSTYALIAGALAFACIMLRRRS